MTTEIAGVVGVAVILSVIVVTAGAVMIAAICAARWNRRQE